MTKLRATMRFGDGEWQSCAVGRHFRRPTLTGPFPVNSLRNAQNRPQTARSSDDRAEWRDDSARWMGETDRRRTDQPPLVRLLHHQQNLVQARIGTVEKHEDEIPAF
jgi:hypothetical protein